MRMTHRRYSEGAGCAKLLRCSARTVRCSNVTTPSAVPAYPPSNRAAGNGGVVAARTHD